LLCTTYKILANISCVKLVPYAKEMIGEYQGHCQRGRSTVDQIFTLRQILEEYREMNRNVGGQFNK
jgi:hypothetical protein